MHTYFSLKEGKLYFDAIYKLYANIVQLIYHNQRNIYQNQA